MERPAIARKSNVLVEIGKRLRRSRDIGEKVQGKGYTSIHVDEFKEVYDDQLPEVEMGGHTFKFCSLPGIVLLKMIAWEDPAESKTSDIMDSSDLLMAIFDCCSNSKRDLTKNSGGKILPTNQRSIAAYLVSKFLLSGSSRNMAI